MLVMSYPSYPYHEGYSSMPSTPRTPYPWDVESNQGQPVNFQQQPEQSLQQQQQQQLQQPQPQQVQHTPPQQEFYDTNPPPVPPIQTIQLEERVPVVPSQRRDDFEREKVQSRPVPAPRGMAEGRIGEFKPQIQVDTSRPSSSAGPASAGSAAGPVRVSPTARGQTQYHPYRRTSHNEAGKSRRDAVEQHVRFVGQGQPQGSMSAPSAPSRISSLGSAVGSLRCALQSSSKLCEPSVNITVTSSLLSSPAGALGRSITPQQDQRRFIIRTDVHYDAEKNVLTAHLELPGLKKRDLSITLSTCVYNRVRQLLIAGRLKPTLPEAGYAIKERKFGEFSRTLAVPYDTKSEDIHAEMQDGLLVLKISLGPPAESQDSQEIPIL